MIQKKEFVFYEVSPSCEKIFEGDYVLRTEAQTFKKPDQFIIFLFSISAIYQYNLQN